VPNGFFPERREEEEEEKEKRRRLPTKQEILEKAIELYYKDHPEAIEYHLTPEQLELKAREGGYLQKAQEELMRGPSEYRAQLLQYLLALRQEVEKTAEELKRLGEKPEWPPPTQEELIQRETKLLNRISALEAEIEKTIREKTTLEEKIKTLQQELEKIKTPKEAPKPEIPKTELVEEARKLWATYRNAVLANDTATAESTLKKLKEIRLKL
jgi:predicted  nucleic acid-binding Zn-ribbon protein